MSNVHPKVSYELEKMCIMLNTIERLLCCGALEICSKTSFNRTNDDGIEFTTTGFCMMPLYHDNGFNGHFEFRLTQEKYDPDEMIYEIRFYSNSVLGCNDTKLFKSIYDPSKYENAPLDENEIYSLFKKIDKEFNRVDEELNELQEIMKTITEINENGYGFRVDDIHDCHKECDKPEKEVQNGGPKPPYKPAYQSLPKHEQFHEWLKQNYDCDCFDE